MVVLLRLFRQNKNKGSLRIPAYKLDFLDLYVKMYLNINMLGETMSKTVLLIVGIVLVLMGIAALIPSWTMASEPTWHAVAKIIIGVIAFIVSVSDKKA